jgi:hypothetical protein
MNEFQIGVAKLFHKQVQQERIEFFGDDDLIKWMPEFQRDDASCMCPPFMGKKYRKGGLIVIPINPGGGNETNNTRNYGDSLLYPLLHDFKSLQSDEADFYWEKIVPRFKDSMMSYPIYEKIMGILNASKTTLDDICFFNFLPYRGRANNYPKGKREMSYIIPKCRENFVKPVLDFLQPSLVVTFGKQVDIYINEFWDDFQFERVSWNRGRAPRPSVLQERADSLGKLEKWSLEKL